MRDTEGTFIYLSAKQGFLKSSIRLCQSTWERMKCFALWGWSGRSKKQVVLILHFVPRI